MSQTQKADDYNLTQPSRSGRAGFESFKNEADGRFYFHFNDAKGVALLFSQAYRREIDREKGILSVTRNAVIEERFEPQNTEGGYFFVIRTVNRQEIARSRVFSSVAELEKQQAFFRKNLSLSADNTATPLADKKNVEAKTVEQPAVATSSNLTSENANLKNKVKVLEAQLETLKNTALDNKEVTDEPLRQVFRIEIYKSNTSDRIHGQIIHPFSDEAKTFNGLDSQTIMTFINNKMQTDLAVVAHQTSEKPSPLPKPSPQLSPVAVINLNNKSNTLQANQPFALTLSALAHERDEVAAGEPCLVEVSAFNLDTRERYKMMEKRAAVTLLNEADTKNMGIRIEPLVLPEGSYRLSLIVHILSSADSQANEKQTWQGGIILQVY